MGLIREPLDVDFTVELRTLTKEEKNAISDYIREYKMKQAADKITPKVSNGILTGKKKKAGHQ